MAKKIITVKLEIDEADLPKFGRYTFFLSKYLKPGNKIPSKVLLSYLTLFSVVPEPNRSKKKTFNLLSIRNKTIQRFTKDKYYDFNQGYYIEVPYVQVSATGVVNPNGQLRNCRFEFTLEKMISNAVDELYHEYAKLKEHPEKSRYKIALFLFRSLDRYRSFLNKTNIRFLQNYKLFAITGFIMHQLGDIAVDKRKTSNSDYYRPVRNLLIKEFPVKTTKKKR